MVTSNGNVHKWVALPEGVRITKVKPKNIGGVKFYKCLDVGRVVKEDRLFNYIDEATKKTKELYGQS